MPAPFRFDRRFAFPVSPEQLWATVEQTDRYPEWWSWLRQFEGSGLEAGSVSHCVIRAPLPYSLEITIEIEDVAPAVRVDARVRGDLDGPASLEIEQTDDGGSSARLRWELELCDRLLRPMATVARPAMVWAHDRVIEIGLREFQRRALPNGSG